MENICENITDINTLYKNLKEAYTETNLNNITSDIVSIYKSKQYSKLRILLQAIYQEEYRDIKTSKCFSKLVMLFHPDRLSYYINELNKHFKNKSHENLSKYTHIFIALGLATNPDFGLCENIDGLFEPEYIMDYKEAGFSIYTEDELNKGFDDYGSDAADYDEPENTSIAGENTFFKAVKRKIYGSMEVELPGLLLEDLEEVDMSEYEIDNLDGVECCKYAKNIDLSNNFLSTINELYDLKHLQELYLSNNNIGYIDILTYLKNLRVIDISNNDIIDISPLFSLEKLEYLNIVGNNIPITQRNWLKNKGVIVVE